MKIFLIFAFLMMPMSFNAQSTSDVAPMPPIEPGVSLELAKWRAAHYSDVRYKLNLTLEKMSPVLKGTLEIRVRVGARTLLSASPQSGELPPIILDWRKIRGHEEKSTISNVTINGRSADLRRSADTPVRMSVASTRKSADGIDALNDDDPFAGGTGDADRSVRSPREPSVRVPFEEHNEHLIFRDGVVMGENVIKLDFTSPILTSGSAITRYVDKEDGSEYIYSLFVPSDASTAFPVFDQPDLKARFELRVLAPSGWKVVSNGYTDTPFASLLSPDLVRAWWAFNVTKPISTYVFAFAAGPFERVSVPPASADSTMPDTAQASETNSTKTRKVKPELKEAYKRWLTMSADPGISIYVRKSQSEKFKPHAAEVFRLNREAIKYFEEYFDYKFPFPKYDLVLIPEFPFGGMEHAGATFLRESSIIFPQEPTKNDHISRALLMFHEASHQWFGDTVTMRWFDDLWLKEGFATFTAYKAMEKIMPEMMAWKVFYERVKQAAYQTDSTKGTTPIYQEIPNLSAAKSAYGNIVYNKAPAFLRQAEFYLGEDKFQTAVRAFLKKHEFGNAGWEDLVKEFETASNGDLKEWAEIWVKKRGLPKIRPVGIYFQEKGHIFPEQVNVLGDKHLWKMKTRAIVVNRDGSRSVEDIVFDGNLDVTALRQQIPILLKGESEFVFINFQDHGYGVFLLRNEGRDHILKNIQNEKDPFLRSMMWGSLWDSVREGELDPREYVELVIRVQSSNFSLSSDGKKTPRGNEEQAKACTLNCEDESTTALLLNRVGTAMNYYMSEPPAAAGSDLRTRVENMLIERMQKATTLGERITYYRAFLNLAASEHGKRVLKELLNEARGLNADGTRTRNVKPEIKEAYRAFLQLPPAIPFKVKDKFDIVTRLLTLGDPDAERLLAELEKTETSDDAKRYAYAARAGIGTADNKAKYWNDFVNNKEISESWIEAAFGPWNSIRHSELTLPYLERSLKELPNHKRNRKIFFVNGWLGAFIGGQRSEEALAIVNKFVADNPTLDRDLRLKILENADIIERAVKNRSK